MIEKQRPRDDDAGGEPQYLKYESVEPLDNYWVGTAYLKNLSGPGQFQVKVRGQREDIDRYSEAATVHEISLEQIDTSKPPDDFPTKPDNLDRETWHSWLEMNCNALTELLDALEDSAIVNQEAEEIAELLQNKWRYSNTILFLPDLAIDLTLDREIEIRPPDLKMPGLHKLKIRIDPTIAAGSSDYYRPSFNLGDTASARIQSIGGDPDLYLYRGWQKRAQSLLPAGYDEQVQASGGSGSWVVRVYAYGIAAASYEIDSSWTFWF